MQVGMLLRRRTFTTAVAAATVAALALPAAAAARAPFPSVTSGPGLAATLNMYGRPIPSRADAVRLARAYDVITVTPSQAAPYLADMRAANPELRLFVYVNGMFSYPSQEDVFPRRWFMRDARGHRIRSRGWGNYLMDPRARAPLRYGGRVYGGWRSWVRTRCADALARGPYTGCFLDMLGTAPLFHGYNQHGAVPVRDSRSDRRFGAARWLNMTGALAARVARRVGAPVVGNGLGNGARFSSAEGSSGILLRYVRGGWAETWMREPHGSLRDYPSPERWRDEVQLLVDAARRARSVNVILKTWRRGTAAQKRRWATFGLASYLVGRGTRSTYEFSAAPGAAPWEADPVDAGLAALGAPAERHRSIDGFRTDEGLYRRQYTGGRVYVNPGSTGVTVDLPHAYTTPSGVTVTSVRVRAHGARILLDAAA